MSDTTKTEVRVIEGWVSKDAFADPCYAGCSFGKQMRPLLADQKATLVIGDKAVPMSTVVELYKDAKMIARTAAALQMSKEERMAIVDHDFAEIAAKYGIKLP